MGLSVHMNKNGIKAHQLALDVISNNIANATTEGYKAKAVRFNTLLSNQITEADVLLNDITPQLAAGATSAVAVTDFSQGTLSNRLGRLDLATTGNQFFAVQNNTGDFFLTRDGSFTIDGTGRLVNGNGHYLVMDGVVPADVSGGDLTINNDGRILLTNQTGSQDIGSIHLYTPNNIETLQPAGQNYFTVPNEQYTRVEAGTLEVNLLEMSNVDLAQELTNMIIMQRAYSLNVKVSQSTDEMMSLINQFNI